MPLSLHAATIPSMLQIIGSAKGWLDTAEESGLEEAELCSTSLIGDMLPFAYQVKSMAVHSAGAIESLRHGVFSPDFSDSPSTFEGLRARLNKAEDVLKGTDEEELESFMGRDMRFDIPQRDFTINFTAENFLLSFSQPNFYFHAATAYGILRMKGLEIGKRDFLGTMRKKV